MGVDISSSSSVLPASLELSDPHVYEPCIRALLGFDIGATVAAAMLSFHTWIVKRDKNRFTKRDQTFFQTHASKNANARVRTACENNSTEKHWMHTPHTLTSL